MLRSWWVSGWRALCRHPFQSAIHVGGLAVGIACCLLILLLVRHELSFDRFHAKVDRTYRLVAAQGERRLAITPGPLGPLAAELPGVKTVARVAFQGGRVLVCREHDCGYVARLLHTEGSFFSVFSFPLLRGDPATALAAPNTVVLSESLARRYFGDADPLGRSLRLELDPRHDCMVTGVVADPPGNTELRYDALASVGTMADNYGIETWTNWNYYTYLVLAPGAEPGPVAASLTGFLQVHYGTPRHEQTQIILQPLGDAHLDTHTEFGLSPADPRQLRILAAIALAILLIACANSANLATALSAARQRELGARKVVGASRRQLVGQLLAESLASSVLATGLAVALVELLVPWYRANMGGEMDVTYDGWLLLGLVGVAVLVAVLAGAYPALAVTGQTPAQVLRGGWRARGTTIAGRFLQVGQFALAIGFVAGTVVMTRQYRLLTHQRLGFDREQVVVVSGQRLGWGQRGRLLDRYVQAVRQQPGVVAAARASGTFGGRLMSTSFDYQGSRRTVYRFFVDQVYLRTLGLVLLAGRDPTGGSDQAAVLVNEALAREFSLGAAVDSSFTFATYRSPVNIVAGVVADYHFRPLRWEVEPLILHPLTSNDDMAGYVLVRLAPGEIPATVASLKQEWERLEPDYPFELSFLDQDLDRQYATEQRWLRTVQAAAAMAVTLACLGLVGLTALAVVQRTREIGIRRVLGASSTSVVSLLVADAVRLVAVAGILAAPAAYLWLRRWLEGFAFRVGLGPEAFVLAAVAVLALATLAAAGQAFRAVLANPVEALRQE